VCTWVELNYETGCCPLTEGSLDSLESCTYCNNSCCTSYAYCVSCCLHPDNSKGDNASSTEETDKYIYCRNVCRLNSRSVINEREWKSEMKYCFPLSFQNINNTNMENDPLLYQNPTRNEINKRSDTRTSYLQENTGISKPISESLLERFNQISKVQKEQEDLLAQLAEEIRKLEEHNIILEDENKSLRSAQLALVNEDSDQPITIICGSFSLRMVFIILLIGLSINIIIFR